MESKPMYIIFVGGASAITTSMESLLNLVQDYDPSQFKVYELGKEVKFKVNPRVVLDEEA